MNSLKTSIISQKTSAGQVKQTVFLFVCQNCYFFFTFDNSVLGSTVQALVLQSVVIAHIKNEPFRLSWKNSFIHVFIFNFLCKWKHKIKVSD